MMLPVQSPTQAPKRKREDDKSCIICTRRGLLGESTTPTTMNTSFLQSSPGYRSCMLEKATLDGCGHSYCKECIQSWIVHRCHQPVCPVCRQPITGYQYEEEQDVTHAADLAQPILVSDDGARVAPATSTDTQLVYSSSTATSNTHEAIPGGNHSVVTDDTAKSLRHVEVHPVPRPTLSAPLQGVPRHHPRHGHHRRTRDGIHHHHHRRPSSTIRPAHARINESEAAALHYRRSVYRQRLHAIPPGESRTTGVPPLASRDVHSARIRTWVTRELQALLDEEDVELLVEFVKGLLVATAAPLGRGGGGAGGGGGVQQTVCTVRVWVGGRWLWVLGNAWTTCNTHTQKYTTHVYTHTHHNKHRVSPPGL